MNSIGALSAGEKNHLNTLLDRGMIVPNAVLGEDGDAESLRGVISRNPLPIAGKNIFPS